MAYQVTPAAIWDAMRAEGMRAEADAFARIMESELQKAADLLAAKIGIETGRASMQEEGFAGLLIPLFAGHEGQEIPECLDGCDTDSEWQTAAAWQGEVDSFQLTGSNPTRA